MFINNNRAAWRSMPIGLMAVFFSLTMVLGVPKPASAQNVEAVDRVIAIVNTEVITARELEARVESVVKRQRELGREVPNGDGRLNRQVLEQLIIERAQDQLARSQGMSIDQNQIDAALETIAKNNRMTVAQFNQRWLAEGRTMDALRRQVRGEITRARLREVQVDSRIQVSDADIDAWLDEQSGVKDQSAEFHLAQILIRLAQDADAAAVLAAKDKADELLSQLAGGADFATLARAYSDDDDAAQSGGSLGWRTLDRMPGLFAAQARGLSSGQVAPVVRSGAGLHVLKLLDKRGGADGAQQSVLQTHVRHILIRPVAGAGETEVLRRLNDIKDRVEGGSETFTDMAKQFSIDGSASQGGDIGWVYAGDTVPAFERAMDQLKPGQISQPVRSQFGIHLIQVVERRRDTASPERRRMEARRAVTKERSEEAYTIWLSELRDQTYVEFRFE